jgi:hypothetical protein
LSRYNASQSSTIKGINTSGSVFHVRGPHDHEIEHAAQGHGHADENEGFTAQIAAVTALIATVGAIFAYMGGTTQANTGLYESNAAIKTAEASHLWTYYQAKSSRQNLAELAIEVVLEAR